jgi:hypothetical protein
MSGTHMTIERSRCSSLYSIPSVNPLLPSFFQCPPIPSQRSFTVRIFTLMVLQFRHCSSLTRRSRSLCQRRLTRRLPVWAL